MTTTDLLDALHALGDPDRAAHAQRYFKTGPGQVGEGDRFLGIRVPALRRLARDHRDLPLHHTLALLRSPIHEARFLALVLLTRRYDRADEPARDALVALYLDHTPYVNHWDLVDASAPHLLGRHLLHRDRRPLYRLVVSPSLWERRIAIVATLAFIRRDEVADTLALAQALLDDPEDLVRKATGWMLREVGKRAPDALEGFLQTHLDRLPRVTLRYAIERMPEPQRARYLAGAIPRP